MLPAIDFRTHIAELFTQANRPGISAKPGIHGYQILKQRIVCPPGAVWPCRNKAVSVLDHLGRIGFFQRLCRFFQLPCLLVSKGQASQNGLGIRVLRSAASANELVPGFCRFNGFIHIPGQHTAPGNAFQDRAGMAIHAHGIGAFQNRCCQPVKLFQQFHRTAVFAAAFMGVGQIIQSFQRCSAQFSRFPAGKLIQLFSDFQLSLVAHRAVIV